MMLSIINSTGSVSTHQSKERPYISGSCSRHIHRTFPTLGQTHLHGRSTVHTNIHLCHCTLGCPAWDSSWRHRKDCSPPPNTHIDSRDEPGDTGTRHIHTSRCRCCRGGCWLPHWPDSRSCRRSPLEPPGHPWSHEVWWWRCCSSPLGSRGAEPQHWRTPTTDHVYLWACAAEEPDVGTTADTYSVSNLDARTGLKARSYLSIKASGIEWEMQLLWNSQQLQVHYRTDSLLSTNS